jgi:glycosyltransferase involved in cell wall biosynthesis
MYITPKVNEIRKLLFVPRLRGGIEVSMNNKISVIVSVYNAESYLEKSIESIMSQTYTNLEIILINDGSTDHSIDIVNNYALKDKRIVVINQQNQGSAAVRNKGIEVAHGEYIGFVDDDDWIDCDMYKTLMDNLIYYNADISICSFRHVDENGNRVDSYKKEKDYQSPLLLNNTCEILKYYLVQRDMNPWNKIYRKNLFDTIQYPSGRTYEDCFTTYRLLEKANSVIVTSEEKYNYVFHQASISNNQFNKKTFDLIEGHIEQHEYIENKYSTLSRYSRRHLFGGLLTFVNKAYNKDELDNYSLEINNIISKVKKYPYEDCSLPIEDEKLVKLLFKSLRSYILAGKIAKKRKENL